MLLATKLILAPSLVVLASLVERRFGHQMAGWTAGFPLVAGPVLLFFWWEQGPVFTADAATRTLFALVSLSAFCLSYAWISRHTTVLPSLVLGWTAYAVSTVALAGVRAGWMAGLAAALVALTAARQLLPRAGDAAVAPRPRLRGELAWRAAAAAALVLTLTGLAHLLGPAWSGLLVPFPVASTVLLVAAHRGVADPAVVRLLSGLLLGLLGFSMFCAMLAFGLVAWGGAAFAAGLLATAVVQTVLRRVAAPVSRPG